MMTMKVTIKTPFAELILDMPEDQVLSWLHQTLNHAATVKASAEQPIPDKNEEIAANDSAVDTEPDRCLTKKPEAKSRAESMFGSRETWETPAAEPQPQKTQKREAYSGFLHVKCEACGKTKSFNAKQPLTYYICGECGARTDLVDMAPVHINCKCGKDFKYRTNMVEAQFTMDCFACGAPVDLELNGKRNAYVTVGRRDHQ
jgi:ribosomal protein S27E